MTETPGFQPAPGEPVPPVPPPVSDAPAAPPSDYAAPPPPPGDYAAPPPPSYQPPPAGYQAPPPNTNFSPPPPAAPTGQSTFAAGASSVGKQFQDFDAKTLQNFDPKTVDPLDWGIIAAGVLAFLFSFFSFYTVKVSVSGFGVNLGTGHGHENAWHGFFGWFGVLVALAAALVLALELVAKFSFPFPTRLVVLGGFGLALLCELIALVWVPIDTGGFGGVIKADKGHGFGYWLVLLCVLAGTGLAAKRFLDHGGKLPGRS